MRDAGMRLTTMKSALWHAATGSSWHGRVQGHAVVVSQPTARPGQACPCANHHGVVPHSDDVQVWPDHKLGEIPSGLGRSNLATESTWRHACGPGVQASPGVVGDPYPKTPRSWPGLRCSRGGHVGRSGKRLSMAVEPSFKSCYVVRRGRT